MPVEGAAARGMMAAPGVRRSAPDVSVGTQGRTPVLEMPEESKLDALLPAPVLLSAFVAASLVLALTPGPAVLYIVARSLAQGRRSGLASVGAVAVGNLANAVAAALGLAALFAVSSLAFTVVKWAGAAYLVWLGIQALRRPSVPGAGADGAAAASTPARQPL